ncbi:MAG: NERD domain-containing protein [Arthrobacter sp.]|uniref:nuclease-related domain-containing DEAD/DEAH box helicase n=1 Tax=Arthrobacter sp. TaxID=1667 RepID=UPI00346A8ACA
MARCIPEEPEFGEGHEAEREVFERLRAALPDDVVVAHSVRVRNGRAEHEIDFLVLWPHVGLAAIEVKGGLVGVENGQWHQSGGRGGKRKIGSPLAQCQDAAHAFRESLAPKISDRLSSRFAYVACFPYTRVPRDWDMAGVPRALILDAGDLDAVAERLRSAIETEGGGAAGLSPKFLERILPHLRGDLEPEELTADAAHERESGQDSLTVRQATLLSATRSLHRVRFVGGAGSGKTWLAVEKAKRLCREGKNVGLFCYNKGLGMYLRDQVQDWRQKAPVHTGEFHEYARRLGVPPGAGQDYFDEEMPRALLRLAAALPRERKLDAIVVDEAQDFAPLWWEALRACLKDPDDGAVYAFMDDRQDVYRRWGAAAPSSLESTLATLHVDENLRNTRTIAETFRPLAGEHFTPRGSTGLPVRVVECRTEDAVEQASDCVDALIEEGWSNGQIALLTTRHRHPVHQSNVGHDGVVGTDYWRAFHDGDEEFYGHVLGFKGLERSVVILCVDGFRDLDRAPEQLYVGLSRARSLLVVVGDPQLIELAGGPGVARALGRAERWRPETVAALAMG